MLTPAQRYRRHRLALIPITILASFAVIPMLAQMPPRSAASDNVWHMRKVNVTTPVMNLQTHGSKSIQGMTMLVPNDWSSKASPL